MIAMLIAIFNGIVINAVAVVAEIGQALLTLVLLLLQQP